MPSFTRHRPCNSHIQPLYHSNSSTFSISPSPSPSPSPPPTIHNRRTLSSRTNSNNSNSSRQSPPPPSLAGLHFPISPFASLKTATVNPVSHSESETAAPSFGLQKGESDAECWSRMLALQREYHCYNSARLEAAVEALEKGCRIEDVPMPSRFCLDLLNEELEAQIKMTNLQ
ncbi:hypothetical protein VTL71DRAFT_14505 [Oculimacula yallundae]|uniref:Uncharacterized protein n=1 Tax=Oculimacula yallundae TaxID=86028 RepID=A0ABR4CKR3_9HELO